MRATDVIIIGGGQAGLAMSQCLSLRGIDHLVIERGRVGERWRAQSWDSLRLLSPNWETRLPGRRYRGFDGDGFMSVAEWVSELEGYADRFAVPIQEHTAVVSIDSAPFGDGYLVATTSGTFRAPNVVLATGHCQQPAIPQSASRLPGRVQQLSPASYRNPDQIAGRRILVVGASASGIQIAAELSAAGKELVVAAGRHTRIVRRYRGRDIMWWLDQLGKTRQPTDPAKEPPTSMQLVGREDNANLDLGVLSASGAVVTGRLTDITRGVIRFGRNLRRDIGNSDRRLYRLLDRIDHAAAVSTSANTEPPGHRPPPLDHLRPGPRALDVGSIDAVVWATGYRRSYPYLRVPVTAANGELVHTRGVTRAPGLYALGLHCMRRYGSATIDGVGADATELAAEIARDLNHSLAA